ICAATATTVIWAPITVMIEAVHRRRKAGVFNGVVSANTARSLLTPAHRMRSGLQAPHPPARIGPAERGPIADRRAVHHQPVVHPVVAAAPELDLHRGEHVAAPVARQRDRIDPGE